MCFGLRALSLAVALLAAPALASAAVEGSPHDLIAQGYDVAKVSATEERCNRCHVSASSAARGLLPETPPVLAARWGPASLGCFSCHDGTTLVVPEADASLSAFHPDAHGGDPAGYEDLGREDIGLPLFAGGRLECLTCHDPHDDSRRPYLRLAIGELCLRCHSRQAGSAVAAGEENLSGNHPSGMDPEAIDRKRHPLDVTAPFRTGFPSPYPLRGGKEERGVHWDLGGHLAGGDSGQLACVTCHAVHGDEKITPRAALLTLEPVNDVANLFCEGCHAGERADEKRSDAHPNPGGTITARTYHPVDDDVSNGEDRALEVTVPPDWPVGGGNPPRLLCGTCHRAHAARPGSALLRAPEPEGGFCESCHDDLAVYHHPVGKDAKGDCSKLLPPPRGGETQAGVLCSSCHVAHNAGLGADEEEEFVPLLKENILSLTLCTTCHPEGNPTCKEDKEGVASHFLGDSTLEDTYADPAPPLRTEPWPESKLVSRYGGDAKQVLICLSCHAFQAGAIVSGDAGTGRFLLARSGNPVEWTEDAPNAYLCTGCHSENPGTGSGNKGHTHPLMQAQMERFNREPDLPATATSEGHVNCDSCHRPHEALTRGGYYILEAVASDNVDPKAVKPVIDFTALCHLCHEPGKY